MAVGGCGAWARAPLADKYPSLCVFRMRNGMKPVTIAHKPQWRLVGVAGERLPMKAKMIHRCIHVLDLEKSLAFYKRAFGLDVVREITRAEGSRKIVYMGNNTTDFELELVWESGRTEAYDNGSNDTHLAFAVDDVDAARLLHDEMDCVCHELGRDGIYFIEDPDGCCLEIVPSDLWD